MLSLAEASCFLLRGGKKDKFMWRLILLWSVVGWRGSGLCEPIHEVPISSVAHWVHRASLWGLLYLKSLWQTGLSLLIRIADLGAKLL